MMFNERTRINDIDLRNYNVKEVRVLQKGHNMDVIVITSQGSFNNTYNPTTGWKVVEEAVEAGYLLALSGDSSVKFKKRFCKVVGESEMEVFTTQEVLDEISAIDREQGGYDENLDIDDYNNLVNGLDSISGNNE